MTNKHKIFAMAILSMLSSHAIAQEAGSRNQDIQAAAPSTNHFLALDASAPLEEADPSSKKVTYSVRTTDIHLRNTLSRWSLVAGWQFSPDQWAIPYDIPVIANADLGNDFKSSVRALISATELTDLPLQPCFYSNKVLRIVPISQKCDRNVD